MQIGIIGMAQERGERVMLTKEYINSYLNEYDENISRYMNSTTDIIVHGIAQQALLAITLQAENDKLKVDLEDERRALINIKKLTDEHALIDGDIQKLVIITLFKLFHESGAENYLVMGIKHDDEDYELTMQKKGKLSPADMNKLLQTEIDRLKAANTSGCEVEK